ncbi:hypothetical protein ACCT14_13460 [Rhizobium brockwellii]|uniref:hypothetical protein n=1 Tax=Rhizobium brockwellii TaxID=3019932 RepID=UPI003F9470B8
MKVTGRVTGNVTGIDGDQVPRGLKKRKGLRYITRSGTAYVFQMRLPKHFSKGTNVVIRLSLGPCSYNQARYISDLLAAEARIFIRRHGERMDEREFPAINPTDLLDNETSEENAVALKTYLRMMYARIKSNPPDAPGSNVDALQAFKGLVGVVREVKARTEGNPFNEIVAENADFLKERYLRELRATTSVEQLSPSNKLETPLSHPRALMLTPENVAVPVEQAVKIVVQNGPDRMFATPKDAPIAPWILAAIKADKIKKPKMHPAYDLDRRYAARPASSKPLFSHIAEEYFTARDRKTTGNSSQVTTERARAELFLALIGDHPVDTYTPTDLQAYVNALKYWPARPTHRAKDSTPDEILIGNVDLHLKPMARKTILDGYVTIVKTIISSGATAFEYRSLLAGVSVDVPDTAMPSKSVSPLSAQKIGNIFNAGIQSGYIDTVMLPLLGHLTGRRIGLLTHLQGSDIQEKFPGVFVANIDGIVSNNGIWTRVPYKADASLQYFILHDLLRQIGFISWAMGQGSQFLFPTLMCLADPAKSASSYMQRLFAKAGVEPGRKEVFHSLRAGFIDEMREQDVDQRTSRLQSGHEVGHDIHELYGTRSISEKKARQLCVMPLNPEIDYSAFKGIDFEALSTRRRRKEDE